MDNPKNQLQEYFQRERSSLPKYEYFQDGGAAHLPLWKCSVSTCDKLVFTSESYSNKTEASMCAARKALNYLEEIPELVDGTSFTIPQKGYIFSSDKGFTYQLTSTDTYIKGISTLSQLEEKQITPNQDLNQFPITSTKVIIVDVENMQKFIDELGSKANKYTIYAFVGEHHCLANKVYKTKVNVIHSPSTRKDGSDTCIQVYVGMLLTLEKFDEYIIVTRDHFGSSLVEMIQCSTLGWKGKKAYIVTDPSKII